MFCLMIFRQGNIGHHRYIYRRAFHQQLMVLSKIVCLPQATTTVFALVLDTITDRSCLQKLVAHPPDNVDPWELPTVWKEMLLLSLHFRPFQITSM
jgi:hypothetical protein